jgi:exodeoxyribonuclease VII large subunit
MTQAAPLTVSQVNAMVGGVLSQRPEFEDMLVEGEITNIRRPATGHVYFNLKDRQSQLRCVCFSSSAGRLGFRPEDGMKVVVHGQLGVYSRNGDMQMTIDAIDPVGAGAMALAIAQRKERLQKEGLFDLNLKRPLPHLPRRIALVTSHTGAALRDVCTVVQRRAPCVDVVLVPAHVHGGAAAPGLVNALNRAGRVAGADVVLLVRGGGSPDDLLPFQDEAVVRAVRACALPVVTGVGHETDTTLVDYAADRRAATPSQAAEIAVPDVRDLRREIAQRRHRLLTVVDGLLTARRGRLSDHARRLTEASPERRLARMRDRYNTTLPRLSGALRTSLQLRRDHLGDVRVRLTRQDPAARLLREGDRVTTAQARLQAAHPQRLLSAAAGSLEQRVAGLTRALGARLETQRQRLGSSGQRLAALSPQRTLERGYTLAIDPLGGTPVTSVAAALRLRTLRLRFADGEVDVNVGSTPTSERMYDPETSGD